MSRSEKMYVAGIDVGSGRTKAVIIDHNGNVLARESIKTLANFAQVGGDALAIASRAAKIPEEEIRYVASTGLGRYSIPFRNIQITEITCAARGAKFLFPDSTCVIDMGAQNTRAIKLGENGKVKQFRSNDRCAAGSGGFLEKAARYLEVSMEDIGKLSLKANHSQSISSVCAVLGESEIINHVSNGSTVEEILRGIHESLADRATGLLKRVGLEGKVVAVGGVARQGGMIRALEEKIGARIYAAPRPEFVCALGAALLGLHRLRKLEEENARSECAGSRQ
jgi:predicted CoA-substrate-specific enzyme activase